ncbi:MAG: VOC family protein [Sphingomonadaceae bacterium]
MKVNALDHVNIITDDLDATATFYEELLGLDRRDGPPPLTPQNCQWMYDLEDRPILHINSQDCPRFYDRETKSGPTGAVHHVALNCSGYDEMVARLDGRGMAYEVNLVEAIGLRQISRWTPTKCCWS